MSHFTAIECTKFDFGWTLPQTPLGELTALPRPSGWISAGILLRGERGREGWGEEVEGDWDGRLCHCMSPEPSRKIDVHVTKSHIQTHTVSWHICRRIVFIRCRVSYSSTDYTQSEINLEWFEDFKISTEFWFLHTSTCSISLTSIPFETILVILVHALDWTGSFQRKTRTTITKLSRSWNRSEVSSRPVSRPITRKSVVLLQKGIGDRPSRGPGVASTQTAYYWSLDVWQ